MKLKDLYIDFFVSKGHKQIPSAPVVPENDPSVLFNTAGMQPLIPFLMGGRHPYGNRLCDYQKCIRTNDLEEVGDSTHHTFFEQLGNWSLGDYFKQEAIEWSFEFITEVLHMPIERLAVTVYGGSETIHSDEESYNKWLSLGIPETRIAKTIDDNFWIAGESGPCGPDTEMFYFRSDDEIPEVFDPEDDRWVELWKEVIDLIASISGLSYEGNERSMRIIADHVRAAVFISADPTGIKPSNTDQGYILRRLIRRAIRHAKKLNIDIFSNWEEQIAKLLIEKYKKYYKELEENEKVVLEV